MKKFLLLIAVVFVFMACSKPPVEEMNAAYDAVMRADNDANAVSYAANTLTHARDLLARMQSEADAKRHDAAKQFAAEAVSAAERAISEGRAGAERAGLEAQAFLNSLTVPLAETAGAVNAAIQNRNLDINADALSEDLSLAYRSYDDALDSVEAGSFQDAVAQGNVVRFLLSDINGKLNSASQAVLRK